MGLIVQKEVSFVPLVQLGLVGFSRVIKVRVGIRVGIGIRVNLVLELGWDRTSVVTVSETKTET